MGIKSFGQFPFPHMNFPKPRSLLFTGRKIFPPLIFAARVHASIHTVTTIITLTAILTFAAADANSERKA
jgi:hypothetical protein